MARKDFMGKGIALPFRANLRTGDIEGASQERNVRNSVIMFLSTRLMEMDLTEGYGMPPVLFENLDAGTADALSDGARRGLERFEPRISVTRIYAEETIAQSGGHGIRLVVNYIIRATGKPDSAVYTPEA